MITDKPEQGRRAEFGHRYQPAQTRPACRDSEGESQKKEAKGRQHEPCGLPGISNALKKAQAQRLLEQTKHPFDSPPGTVFKMDDVAGRRQGGR